jgi:hypothetical protein
LKPDKSKQQNTVPDGIQPCSAYNKNSKFVADESTHPGNHPRDDHRPARFSVPMRLPEPSTAIVSTVKGI